MWLQSLATELPITLADGTVWLSIGQGLLIGAVCLLFGVWVARLVGLLAADAPAGEMLGVGLASGLLVLTSWWAAVMSGGRSSFTPVAVGFVIAIARAAIKHWRRVPDDGVLAPGGDREPPASPSKRRRSLMMAMVGGGTFIVAVALLYGSTLVLSPRDGVQPLEFMDEAYYAVLGRDLAQTGTETIYSPSGFAAIEGLPTQSWYHWGETWLAAAVITIFGADALDARHLIVLPLLLLASASLTGTLVRRMTGATLRGAYLFGFLACIFLAPLPFARGLIFGITTYGLAAVAVLLAMYGLAVLSGRRARRELAVFAGSAAAMIVPAHVVIAVLSLIGLGSVWAVRIGQSLATTRRLPQITLIWRWTLIAAGIVLVATLAWGVVTQHGTVANGLSPTVASFNTFWWEVVTLTALGAGAFLAIVLAWFLSRRDNAIEADLYLGTAVLVLTGALVWGARLGDFNTFHLFFGGLAIFGMPAAAIAVWSTFQRLRARGLQRLALVVVGLCVVQQGIGIQSGISQLQVFGPGVYPAVPLTILADVRGLPPGASLAYACGIAEESVFWDARLMGISAHTGRRLVPMCFQAETLGVLTGGELDTNAESPLFRWAPQRSLYPDATADPSSEDVADFLNANGIEYIYVDRLHPNSLVSDGILVAGIGETQILRLP